MITYLKVNNTLYPATFTGKYKDEAWNDRETKTVKMQIGYSELKTLMPEDVKWSILCRETDEKGQTTDTEYDNSAFKLSGDLTDHRNGYCSIKMGKLTLAEELIIG